MHKESYFRLNYEQLQTQGIEVHSSLKGIEEIIVRSYEDFDRLISMIYANKKEEWNVYFRGVSNKKYDLQCGLEYGNIEEHETDLINDLYARAPIEFSKCKNNFEMIALMQHYGLPTRFLDFSRNPLIALWFACQYDGTEETADGAVYVALSDGMISKKSIEIICNFAISKNTGYMGINLESIISQEELRHYLFIVAMQRQQLFFIEAPAVDQREKNQQSIFLVATNRLGIKEKGKGEQEEMIINQAIIDDFFVKTEEERKKYDFFKRGLHCYDLKQSLPYLRKIIISQNAKKEILKELSYRGITENFIYPTLEREAKKVKQEYLVQKRDWRIIY